MIVPFSKPSIGDDEIEAVATVMRSGWMAAGEQTAAFEREFAEYISPKYKYSEQKGETGDGTPIFYASPAQPYYCIFTNSGTAALKMAYKWAKEQGFEFVSHPINTFCATYSAAEEMGLPSLGRGDYKNSSDNVRVNVHYGGVKDKTPCFLEDSAHRIEPNDPLVGKIRIYSFYVTKNMTTGSGGMFVTNDKEIYERARLYWRDGLTTSTHDRLSGRVGYEVAAMAGGYDGNDIAAAMGRVQLRKLPQFTARRNEIRDRYNSAFGQQWAGNHLYPYFVDSTDSVYPLIDFLKGKDISCSYHYPGTGWTGVSLPIYADMTNEQVDYVVQCVKEWQDANV